MIYSELALLDIGVLKPVIKSQNIKAAMQTMLVGDYINSMIALPILLTFSPWGDQWLFHPKILLIQNRLQIQKLVSSKIW